MDRYQPVVPKGRLSKGLSLASSAFGFARSFHCDVMSLGETRGAVRFLGEEEGIALNSISLLVLKTGKLPKCSSYKCILSNKNWVHILQIGNHPWAGIEIKANEICY